MSEVAVKSGPALNAPKKAAHAVQISRYGPPEVLKFCDVVLAPRSFRRTMTWFPWLKRPKHILS